MKKKIIFIILLLTLIIPFNVKALKSDYKDTIYKIVDKQVEENKINIYLFHRDGCPHCEKEIKFLEAIEKKYENVNIYEFEVSKSDKNSSSLDKVKTLFKEKSNGVPYTVIGEDTYLGYNEYVGNQIEKSIQKYLEIEKETETEKHTYKLPLIGEVNVRDTSLPLIAIILGLIDGFNPCAMWVLLFLINMFFGMKNKKRMFLYGYTFLFTSALVYFLSMLGISFALNMIAVKWIQRLIAVVAVVAGILNIRNYIKTRNDNGCHVVDENKRKKIFQKANKIVNEEKVILALLGVIALAASVNLVELACSLGFPAIFSDILTINEVSTVGRIIYLIIYVLFYMIDDIVVFTIAVCTLNISTRSTKYTKYVNLLAGIIMIIIGLLLAFKPAWIMFNF